MTNKKGTKRALLSSALALIVCIAMLVGTTFAWFTDSVTSGGNKIVAGNLKVDLIHARYENNAGSAVEKVSLKENPDHKIFDYSLWEPGYTQIEYLQVINKGNLHFMYELRFTSEGALTKLADVIEVYTGYPSQAHGKTRNKALEDMNYLGTVAEIMAKGGRIFQANTGGMELKEDAPMLAYTIALHMKEEAGNEYQGLPLFKGESGFNVTLLATQMENEFDSFGPDYDAFADYDGEISGAASLTAALNAGGTYKVIKDIALDSTASVPAGVTVNLDLGDNTITSPVTAIENKGTMTVANGTIDVSGSTATSTRVIKNHGTLTLEGGSYKGTSALYSYAIWNAGTLTANDAEVIGGFGGVAVNAGSTAEINGGTYTVSSNAGGHAIYLQNGGELVINDGTFKGDIADYAQAYDYLIYASAGSSVKINGGTFEKFMNAYKGDKPVAGSVSAIEITGGTFAVSPDKYGTVADGYAATENSDGTYTVANGIGVDSVTALQTAIDNAKDGDVIVLTKDIAGNVTIAQKAGVSLTVNGNNKTFNGVMTVFGSGRQSGSESLTVKNFNFVAANGADSCIVSPGRESTNSYSYSHNVTVENCTFKDNDGTVDCAAIRHADGGDKNWTVRKCTVDSTMHSLFQINNVVGKLTVDGCEVNSKNGANLNCCTNVEMTNCNFDVKGYAVRFGVKSGGNLGEAKNFVLTNNTLKSACDDGDAVIMFRASAVDAKLTLTGTTLDGTAEISGNTDATTIIR